MSDAADKCHALMPQRLFIDEALLMRVQNRKNMDIHSHLLWYDKEKMERSLVKWVAHTTHSYSLYIVHKFFWATGQNLRKSKPHEMNLIKIYVWCTYNSLRRGYRSACPVERVEAAWSRHTLS